MSFKKKRFKIISQTDSKNCGLACLCMMAHYYGKDWSISAVNDLCYRNKTGISMLNLKDTAERLGFQVKAALISFEKLACLQYPLIAYWNQKHYVVILAVYDHKVVIADPSKGVLNYPINSFLKCWTTNESSQLHKGIVLSLIPTEAFYTLEIKRKPKIEFRKLFLYILPYKSIVFKILVSLLLGAFISLILPLFTQVIVDNGIPSKELGFITLVFLSQIIISVGKSVNLYIQNRLLLYVSTKLSLNLVSDFLKKLLNLKMAFFDSRLVGDLIQRINDFERIESFLCSSLLIFISIIITFLIYGGLIIKYGFSLLLIFIIGSILYIAWIQVFRKMKSKVDYMRFQESSINYSNIVQLITGIQDIKLNTCETKKKN